MSMNAAAVLMRADYDLKLLYFPSLVFSVGTDGYGLFK